MIAENVCPICKNHCSLDKLKCGRGKRYLKDNELEDKLNNEIIKDKNTFNIDKYKKNRDIEKLEEYRNLDIDEKILINLRDTSHTIRNLSEGRGSQKKILILLNEVGKITQKKLTKKLRIKSASSSEVLCKMEESGLIKRRDSKKDKRTMEIKLTKEGKREAVLAKDQVSKLHNEMLSCLNADEKEEFLTIIEKLNLDWSSRYSDN